MSEFISRTHASIKLFGIDITTFNIVYSGMKLFVPLFIWLHICYHRWRARRRRKLKSSDPVLLPIYNTIILIDIIYILARSIQRLMGHSFYGVKFQSRSWDPIRADTFSKAILFVVGGEGLSTFWLFSVISFLVSPSAGRYSLRNSMYIGFRYSGLYTLLYTFCISADVDRIMYFIIRIVSTFIMVLFFMTILAEMYYLKSSRWKCSLYLTVIITCFLWILYLLLCVNSLFRGPQILYLIMSYTAITYYDLILPLLVYKALIDDSRYWRHLEKHLLPTESFDLRANLLPNDSLDAPMLKQQETGHLCDNLLNFKIPLIDFTQLKSQHSMLGIGGYSRVWKGLYKSRVVAVKEMKQETISRITVKQFLRETLLSTKFQHENILKFYGVCVAPPVFVMVFEWCNQGDLGKYLKDQNKKGLINYADRIRLAIQCVRGVSFFHDQGLVHRDLKPQNFLVHIENSQIVVKLADFGSCRSQYDIMPLFKGISPIFAAPEIKRHFPPRGRKYRKSGHSHKKLMYGMEVDVFSFAWTLWAILYDGNWSSALKPRYADMIAGWTPLLDDIPTKLRDILHQCWMVDPLLRPGMEYVGRFLKDLKPPGVDSYSERRKDYESFLNDSLVELSESYTWRKTV